MINNNNNNKILIIYKGTLALQIDASWCDEKTISNKQRFPIRL
jgi:hypothetical protein